MSFAASRAGPSTVPASDGSRTITVLDSQPREEGEGGSHDPSSAEVGRLALRGGRNRPRVVWSEDTVDNEGAGKKSSKICCVYHKPKQFDESSSDESTDSDSSYDGPNNHSHGVRRRKRHHHHHHDADSAEDGGDATRNRESGESVVHELSSEEDVNRYERGSGKAKKGKGVARK